MWCVFEDSTHPTGLPRKCSDSLMKEFKDFLEISWPASTRKNSIHDFAIDPIVFIAIDYDRIEADILPRGLSKSNVDRPSRVINCLNFDAEQMLPFAIAIGQIPLFEILQWRGTQWLAPR